MVRAFALPAAFPACCLRVAEKESVLSVYGLLYPVRVSSATSVGKEERVVENYALGEALFECKASHQGLYLPSEGRLT